jgi:hypothetical protein
MAGGVEEGAVGPAKTLREVLPLFDLRDHLVHFCDAPDEQASALDFVEHGAREGARVICVWRDADLARLRGLLEARGHRDRLQDGRAVVMASEPILKAMVRQGHVLGAIEVMLDLFRTSLDEGHEKMYFASTLTGSLFAGGHTELALDLESFFRDACRELPLAVYCLYPSWPSVAGVDEFRRLAAIHTWVASDGLARPVRVPG